MLNKMILIVALTLAATTVSAADMLFAKLDVDKSGSISKAEAEKIPQLLEQWTGVDADANGEISADEFSKFKAS
jgi:Ca2+-binding EF-hand superfamily protein